MENGGLLYNTTQNLLKFPLSECDFILAVDPAGTDHYVSARTSKTVVLGLATHWTEVRVIFSLHAGYYSTLEMFDHMFQDAYKFRDYLRKTYLEANAGFKVLEPLLKREQVMRGKYLSLHAFPSVGDKTIRIRNDLQPLLDRGLIYCLDTYRDEVEGELISFPQSEHRDILDALSIAVRNSQVPPSPEELKLQREAEETWANRVITNVTGY